MQCQILFSGKNKKNISKCRLLKILPRVLSVKPVGSKIKQTTFLSLFCLENSACSVKDQKKKYICKL